MEDTEDIIGGVSPLKARQASRGGKSAGRATSTSGRRGGFARSTGKRGAGGRNVGGYNVGTRFSPGAAWSPPPSGGTTIFPGGGTKIPPPPIEPPPVIPPDDPRYGSKYYIPGEEGTETRETVTKQGVGVNEAGEKYDDSKGAPKWAEAWEYNIEDIKNKYDDFDKYVEDQKKIQAGEREGATREEIDKSTTTEKVTRTKGTDGRWVYKDADGGEISKEEYEKVKPPTDKDKN